MARSKKPREERFSIEAIRQQQQAWVVWVAEGYLANLQHARFVNAFRMNDADLAAIDRAIEDQARQTARLRRQFFGE